MTTTAIVRGVVLMFLLSATVATAQDTKNLQVKAMAKELAATKTKNRAQFVPVFYQPNTPPAMYLANRSDKVFKWVEAWVKEQSKLLPKKPDSFSTSEDRAQYKAKLAEAIKSMAPLPLELTCNKHYDIEGQFYAVRIQDDGIARLYGLWDKTKSAPDRLEVDKEALRLRSFKIPANGESTVLGHYIAQNGYGAKISVTKYRFVDFFVAVPAGPENEPHDVSALKYGVLEGYDLKIPMTSSQAREADKSIVCLGVVSLSAPAVVYGGQTFKATTADPYEGVRDTYGLLGKLDHILIVNRTTGEVYSRASRSGL